MDSLKKIWLFLLSAFALLFGAFLLERNKRKDAENELNNAEHDKEQAVLAANLENLSKEEKAAIAIHEVEINKKLTDEERLEFLKKL
jgi:hypothetical protein